MKSAIIKNIFSDKEIAEIKVIKDSIKSVSVSKRWPGREVKPLPTLDLLPEKILQTLTDIAISNYKKPLKIYAVAFGKYSKEFGVPKLGPHLDEVPSQFTLDYQLDGNISWPLSIEGKEYVLKNNEALVFEGENVLHWRPKRVFNDGEFLELMWFQFREDDHWSYSHELRPDYSDFKKKLFKKQSEWKGEYDAT